MMLINVWYIYLVPILGYCLYVSCKQWLRAVKMVLRLPGPPTLPFLGNILNSGKNQDFLETLSTAYKKYGGIIGCWMLFNPIVLVLEPKHIQIILGNSKFVDKEILYNALPGIAGTGITTSNGYTWKSHRKHIQPLFNINILEGYISSISGWSQKLVKSLETVNEVRVTSIIRQYMLDVLHEIILGIPSDDDITKMKSPFFRGQNTAIERMLKPWLMLGFIYNLTKSSKIDEEHQTARNKFVSEVLHEMNKKRKDGKSSNQSLLGLMTDVSDAAEDFHHEDVIEEICTFMLAGQDATGVTLSLTLYYLAKHQNIQDKVVDEVNEAIAEASDMNLVTLNKLQYLEQCIKETMRVCPSAPILSRKLCEDIKLDEYVVPAGCNVFISPYATHRLPEYYPNPEKFDPERFSEANEDKLNKFAYLPFSAGPRNCIGYKLAMLLMKVTLSEILRSYRISLVPGREQLTTTFRFLLKIKGSVWLRLEPRSVHTLQ